MNFLEIGQKIRSQTGLGSGPTTMVGQTGQLARVVEWADDSYTEIQNMHGGLWRWLRREFTLSTSASDSSYAFGDCTDVDAGTAITRFKSWRVHDYVDRPRIYLTSSGVATETYLTYLPWDSFKLIYKIGTEQTGFPAHISVDPQNNLRLGPTPNAVYTITGDFYRSAQTLSENTDTPEMPADYHMLIVYHAMEHYGYFSVAQEALARAERLGRRMLRSLEHNQLPQMTARGPMV